MEREPALPLPVLRGYPGLSIEIEREVAVSITGSVGSRGNKTKTGGKTMSSSHQDRIRQKALEIAERASRDPAFMERLKSDPEETLLEAGLPEMAVADYIREAGLTAEVGGYILEELDGLCILTVVQPPKP
jgi:hypothetical protein